MGAWAIIVLMKPDLLIHSEYFSNKLDCDLYFKPEWHGPTRSHKDKWAKFAIKLAKASGANKVAAISSGNQGLALAVEAHRQNVDCAICITKSIDPTYLELFKKYGAQVFIGDDEKAKYDYFNKLVSKGYFPLGVTHEQRAEGKQMPGIDAYKLTAREITNSLEGTPDIIVFPTAYADHPEGVLRGFIEQHENGQIPAIPKFVLVRANERDGGEASSIATDRTTPYITDVITRSNGEYVYVNNQEMHVAHDAIKKIHGWDIELASAASLAGLEKLPKVQLKKKKVVVMLTALADKKGI
jgi:threonine synthase